MLDYNNGMKIERCLWHQMVLNDRLFFKFQKNLLRIDKLPLLKVDRVDTINNRETGITDHNT